MDSSVTIFRSGDHNAEQDAIKVLKLLNDSAIEAVVLDDQAAGILPGVWEVRVAAADSARADALIAAHPFDDDEYSNPDESEELDMVTVLRTAGTGADMEAMAVKGMLESNGITAMVVADARWPNLPEQVRVPREHLTEAKRLIANALEAGAAGAAEAEAQTE